MFDIIVFIVCLFAFTVFCVLLIRFVFKEVFKYDTKTKVALLRHDYYIQKNRTPWKDEEFEKEVEKLERDYGLK